jgi:hypothetical protein
VPQAFSPQSDLAPKLLGVFNPAAAPQLYAAWENVEAPGGQVEVYTFRANATLFASSFVGAASSTTTPSSSGLQLKVAGADPSGPKTTTSFEPPDLNSAWDGPFLCLDAVYDKIVAGSWVAIESPDSNGNLAPKFFQVTEVQKASVQAIAPNAARSATSTPTGFVATVTQLLLNPAWTPVDFTTSTLQKTIVHTQSELLPLAEEPLDIDIEGDTIELDGIYDGLESGRWIIVSGARTDISHVKGVTASELVMVAGVEQGARTLFCAQWPFAKPPFTDVTFITAPNKFGDRLVVGTLVADLPDIQQGTVPDNQQYCDQVELAPGFWVSAYVPTVSDPSVLFQDFSDLLVDSSGNPFILPTNGPGSAGQLWAWRISSTRPHTILTLANRLAYKYDVTTVTIYGNVVKATHGQTVNETLGSGDGSQILQQFTLKKPPLTFVPASNAQGVNSTLTVYVNQVAWAEVDTLADAGSRAREFVTQTDDNNSTNVGFGNGVNGTRLPTGTGNVTAIYRSGIGTPGNVDAGQISLLQTRPLNVKAVVNPMRASGGADRDSRDQARRNAPVSVLSLDRLVSVQDYADFSRTFAGIGKASASRLSDGARQLVHVTIAGAEDIPIDLNSDLYRNLVQALSINGDPYQPVQVALRKLKLLVIVAQAKVLPDYQWETVAPNLRTALTDVFGFDRRELGQPAFQSEAVAAMQAVEGVAYVLVKTFDAVGEDFTVGQLAGLATSLALKKCIEANLAQHNPSSDPTDPSSRILPAELVYLTPDISDTLLLTELTT